MTAWHTLPEREVLAKTESRTAGLSSAEAARRLSANGPNQITEGKRKTLLGIFFAQFSDLMIWVLIGAAAVSAFVAREMVDTSIIMVVVLLNAVLGTVQESRAEAALDALREMAAPSSTVLRGGREIVVPAHELVVGDVVRLEAGDAVPADLWLLECASLKVEESALTGESVPVDKTPMHIPDPAAPLGDRLGMAFMSTSVTYGRGTGMVVATGMDTQMGAIAAELQGTKKELTPLQKTLNQISNALSIGILAIAAAVFSLTMLAGDGGDVIGSFMISVSLAVAAIPEGMVAVVTIVLALGMGRMAGRGAIIRRLPAVETLGSTQVICSDKTGTLTQNRMTVTRIYAADKPLLFDAMGHGNDSRLNNRGAVTGDPTETALVEYLLQNKIWTRQQVRTRRRAGEIPFDSERKLSTVAIAHNGGMRVFVKGAPDVLLARCAVGPAAWRDAERENEAMAADALRVLAFAYKDVPGTRFSGASGMEYDLTFIGLCGMADPPRPEAKKAIATCKRAGIRPVMITGDHKITAVAIARELGILGRRDGRRAITGPELEAMDEGELLAQVEHIGVYARVAPEHKSRIVAAWQRRGQIVSMTGDGVNDAPALRCADIGVAMGISGTDVSRGASDMVLTDDNFATIVTAVGEGRRIYDNIHKTVRFLLSSNAGEVLAVLAATLAGWTAGAGHVFLAPVHILWINLVTDTFPALALGVEPAEDDIMERAPRDPKKPFFSGREWWRIITVGAAEAALTVIAFLLGRAISPALGTTMAFLTLSLSQLFAALGFQSERNSVFNMTGRHRPLWLAFFGSGLLQLIVVLLAPLRSLFGLEMPGALQWMQVAALCLCMLLFIEAQKWLARKSA